MMTPPPHLPLHVRAALVETRARLNVLYGDRLARLVLYGSHARGDAREDSDLDLLVVLRGPYDPYEELRSRLIPLSMTLLDRYGVLASLQPYGEKETADLGRPLMRNVQDEGIEV
jgi:uncharacterized protein